MLLALRISADLVSPTRREGNYVDFKGIGMMNVNVIFI